jgi:hypothetical protein
LLLESGQAIFEIGDRKDTVQRMEQLRYCTNSAWRLHQDAAERSFHRWGIFAGNNFRSTFPITMGWCSPALPANVYDRSNPLGPSTFISQLSFARKPTIDTRQSPALSLRACSTSA